MKHPLNACEYWWASDAKTGERVLVLVQADQAKRGCKLCGDETGVLWRPVKDDEPGLMILEERYQP